MTLLSRTGTRLARIEAGVARAAPVRVLRPRGEVDACSAPRLRDDLRREVEACPAVVAVDLSDLEFLGVAGLSVLLEAEQFADERGTAVLLVGSPAPSVERLLGLVGWPVAADAVVTARGIPW
ncbi:anti-anti-sigma factor [Pseudonocardia antarctica]|uniref:Anti-anti-sigma factor n=2 Tax=Pseudonocardia alni TaxID=33907 RepID=A0A852VYW1_PSEA5|nr:STAS domain-containing protein [Pseudonocardia antarctica]NYG02108.1 anti-anti-sigma factor [Pseudonocardia antarctica]